MVPSLRYVSAALLLGLVAVWASENMFWIVPPSDVTVWVFLLGWGIYSLAAAAALSAVLLTGVSGLWGAFLGGAILGYSVEGAIVSTIYDAFPAQLVWTALAWHALISGGVFVGIARAPQQPLAAVSVWTVATCGSVFWALYWPTERADLPSHGALAVYLVLPGVLAIAAHRILDRLMPLAMPPRSVLLIAPIALALIWLGQSVAAPSPVRLAVWPCLALMLWLMRRCGPGAGWGGGLPLWQAALPLLPALTVTAVAPPLWSAFGPVATNIPFALATGLVSLVLVVRAALRRRSALRDRAIPG